MIARIQYVTMTRAYHTRYPHAGQKAIILAPETHRPYLSIGLDNVGLNRLVSTVGFYWDPGFTSPVEVMPIQQI